MIFAVQAVRARTLLFVEPAVVVGWSTIRSMHVLWSQQSTEA